MHTIGKVVIVFGAVIIIIGLIIYFFGDKLSWLGHLPGDIRIEKENFKFYLPITTMAIISILISIIIRIIQKFH